MESRVRNCISDSSAQFRRVRNSGNSNVGNRHEETSPAELPYPGVGTLLVDAVYAGDYGLVLGVTTVSILAVSFGVLVIDLLYPLIDPRVELR